MYVLCSNWWCRKHVREYLPIVWLEEPNFVGYLKSANIYIVRFLRELAMVKSDINIFINSATTSIYWWPWRIC